MLSKTNHSSVTTGTRARIKWADVLVTAASIVRSYDTSVTLRQLFYRLVSTGTLANTDTSYKRLSEVTAAARRAGTFPELTDRKRSIDRAYFEHSGKSAIQRTVDCFRLDRARTQPNNILIAVEKDGLVTQLTSWFGDRGLPVTALQGYCSQSHIDTIRRQVRDDGRPAVLLYAGDFDPSGEDILRDFTERTGCWAHVVPVALTLEQVDRFNLPENPGKKTDARAKEFARKYGRLVQVELDALDPRDLHRLYEDALAPFWDVSAFESVMLDEAGQRAKLGAFAAGWAA